MRSFLTLLFVLVCLSTQAQPAPVTAASQAQVNAGTAGAPFYVTPATLAGFSGVGGSTNSYNPNPNQFIVNNVTNLSIVSGVLLTNPVVYGINVNGLTNGSPVYILNTNYSNIQGLYAVGFTNPAVNGFYPLFGLVNGKVSFSNTLNNGMLISSNLGTGGANNGKWGVTNLNTPAQISFSPKTNQLGYPTNGVMWANSASGGSGYVIPLGTNTLSAISFTQPQTNNQAFIQTSGSDMIGIPGGYPFQSHDGAEAFILANGLSSQITTVYWGRGVWATGSHQYPMYPSEGWIGAGAANTIIGVGLSIDCGFNGAGNLSTDGVRWNTNNTITDMTVSNVIIGTAFEDQPILSGLSLYRDIISNTNNAADSLLCNFTAGTKGGATNVYAKDCVFLTTQDCLAGINGFTADNCTFIGNGGATGFNVRNINASDARCLYTINGGSAYLYNSQGTLTSAVLFASAAGVMNVNGLQATVFPMNGTNFGVYNTGGATMNGYYTLNGAYQYLGGFTNPPFSGFNSITNVATMGFISNFTGTVVSPAHTYTNLLGSRANVYGYVTCTAGGAALTATAEFSIQLTINGTTIMPNNPWPGGIEAQGLTQTNTSGYPISFELGPGDYFQPQTETSGGASSVVFTNFYMIAH